MEKVKCTLLVDDDEATNFLNELLIEELHMTNQLLIARNGKEALQVIQQRCIDNGGCPELILLDINMPVMDGFEFLKAFEALEFNNKKSVVVVMLTTSQAPKDVERVKEFAIADFLNKPLTEEALKEVMDKHFHS